MTDEAMRQHRAMQDLPEARIADLQRQLAEAQRDRDGYNQLQGEYREKYEIAKSQLAEAHAAIRFYRKWAHGEYVDAIENYRAREDWFMAEEEKHAPAIQRAREGK